MRLLSARWFSVLFAHPDGAAVEGDTIVAVGARRDPDPHCWGSPPLEPEP